MIFGDADDSFARNRVEISEVRKVYDLVVNEIDVTLRLQAKYCPDTKGSQ